MYIALKKLDTWLRYKNSSVNWNFQRLYSILGQDMKLMFSSVNDKKEDKAFSREILQILINTLICVTYSGDRIWEVRQSDSGNFEKMG